VALAKSQFTWDWYPGKKDPRMNTALAVHVLANGSNCDAKVICDVYGAAKYSTKAVGYATKADKKSKHLASIVSSVAADSDPDRPAASVIMTVLNRIINRDYSAQELAALATGLPSTMQSFTLKYASFSDKNRVGFEVDAEAKELMRTARNAVATG
jgi:hypothetical protein